MSALADTWLQSATGSRVQEFYSAIGVELRGDGAESSVRCFANSSAHNRDDRNPSCGVNLITGLWCCHGCGAKGNAYNAALALGYSEARARELAQAHGLFLEVVKDEPKPRLPDERQLRKWTGALRCSVLTRPGDVVWSPAQLEMSRVLLGRLWVLKGWTARSVVRCGLGWDGERLVFAVRDKRLKRVGVVRYLPGAAQKMVSMPGSKRGLFPAPEVLSRRYPLFIVEGEPAAVSVRACGLQAVGIPGAQSWRPEWAQRLWGFKRMIMLPDADAPGRDLAERVSRTIPNIRVVDISPGATDGSDVGDWIAEAAREGGLRQMRRVLEAVAA